MACAQRCMPADSQPAALRGQWHDSITMCIPPPATSSLPICIPFSTANCQNLQPGRGRQQRAGGRRDIGRCCSGLRPRRRRHCRSLRPQPPPGAGRVPAPHCILASARPARKPADNGACAVWLLAYVASRATACKSAAGGGSRLCLTPLTLQTAVASTTSSRHAGGPA